MKNRQKNQQNERTVFVMWFPLLRVFFDRVFVTVSYPTDGASGRGRTADARSFNPTLYQTELQRHILDSLRK